VAYLNNELGVNLLDNADANANAKGNDGGLIDPPVIDHDVQPPDLTEEEAPKLAIVLSELGEVAKWQGLAVLLRESTLLNWLRIYLNPSMIQHFVGRLKVVVCLYSQALPHPLACAEKDGSFEAMNKGWQFYVFSLNNI
jgi:hypothetical protein